MSTPKKPDAKILADWAHDQLDPDNWFEIPEFGVLPADVEFEGFGNPIVCPGSSQYQTRVHVRNLIRTARDLARAEFKTLKELLAAEISGLDAVEANEEMSSRQSAAVIYRLVTMSLGSVFSRHPRPSEPLEELSFAASMLADWAHGKTSSALFERLRAMKEGGAKGGRRSAKTRQEIAVVPAAVVRAAEKLGWPTTTKGVNKTVAQSFPVTSDRIGQILREEIEERNSTKRS